MSSFLVSVGLVDALLSFAAAETLTLVIPPDAGCNESGEPVRLDMTDPESRDAAGQIMFEANGHALASRYGIRGIPTLMLFRNGEVLETRMGAQSRSQMTQLLDGYV